MTVVRQSATVAKQLQALLLGILQEMQSKEQYHCIGELVRQAYHARLPCMSWQNHHGKEETATAIVPTF